MPCFSDIIQSMKQFDIIDISGDAGICAYGHNLSELFKNAALGMYNLITDISDIIYRRTINISLHGSSTEGLLVAFLNELIFYFDAYGFIGRDITITELNNNRLSATVSGEDFDPVRHEKRLLIKAATYHKLQIREKNDLLEADVIFDI